jgi:hypothetical protein
MMRKPKHTGDVVLAVQLLIGIPRIVSLLGVVDSLKIVKEAMEGIREAADQRPRKVNETSGSHPLQMNAVQASVMTATEVVEIVAVEIVTMVASENLESDPVAAAEKKAVETKAVETKAVETKVVKIIAKTNVTPNQRENQPLGKVSKTLVGMTIELSNQSLRKFREIAMIGTRDLRANVVVGEVENLEMKKK